MRAFLMCAALTVAALTVGATAVQAHDWHRGYYYGRLPVVVVRPAPIVIAPAPVVAYPAPVVVPAYQPAPVIVQPMVRPIVSLRFGIGR